MEHRRELLLRIYRVRGCLGPTRAADSIVRLSLRIRTNLPGGWRGPASHIVKLFDRIVPGDLTPVLDGGLSPAVPVAIAARIDELLELAVGHFVLVDPVLGHGNR